jgi:hypothetical protein
MRLNVRTSTGASHNVVVDGDDTVASVKTKLQGMTGVHPAQRLPSAEQPSAERRGGRRRRGAKMT